jgi:hypothetical protein
MAWLSSLPTGITVSEDRYAEIRQKPSDPDKDQYRQHEVRTIEFRGVDFNTADVALIGFPAITTGQVRNRSLQAIGGGGYNVIEVLDIAIGGWIDFP